MVGARISHRNAMKTPLAVCNDGNGNHKEGDDAGKYERIIVMGEGLVDEGYKVGQLMRFFLGMFRPVGSRFL